MLSPPPLGSSAGEPEALERNPHLDHVSRVGQHPLRLVDEIRIPIHVAAAEVAGGGAGAFAPDAVVLHAERVDAEEEGAAAVVEGVEVDGDVVVVADVVAVGHAGVDGAGLAVMGHDAEVDGGRAVPDQHVGPLLRRPAVHRLVLGKAAESGGLGPGGLVEAAIHLNFGFDARNGDGGRAASRDRSGCGLDLEEEREGAHGRRR